MSFTPMLDRSEVLALVVRKLPWHVGKSICLNPHDLNDSHDDISWPEKSLSLTGRLYEFVFFEVFMFEERAGRHLLA